MYRTVIIIICSILYKCYVFRFVYIDFIAIFFVDIYNDQTRRIIRTFLVSIGTWDVPSTLSGDFLHNWGESPTMCWDHQGSRSFMNFM